jgi:hypothetical protein
VRSSEIWIPPCCGAYYDVEEREQLPHAGDERGFLRLPGCDESLMSRLDRRIPPRGHERSHREHGAHWRAPAVRKVDQVGALYLRCEHRMRGTILPQQYEDALFGEDAGQ